MAAASPLVKRSQVIRRSKGNRETMESAKAAAGAARATPRSKQATTDTRTHDTTLEARDERESLERSSSSSALSSAEGEKAVAKGKAGDSADQSDQTSQGDSLPTTSTSTSASSSSLKTSEQVPTRRSMTRARKPSSRLLPSPSPPPSRPSSYYNPSKTTMNARSSSVGSSKRPTSSEPSPNNAEQTSSDAQDGEAPQTQSQADTASSSNPTEEGGFGPGKRKRKPSTMTKPPATITKAPSPSAATGVAESMNTPSPSNGTAPATKVRIRLAPKSNVQEDVSKLEGKGGVASKSQAKERDGYDSDGNAEGAEALLLAHSEPDTDLVMDDESEMGLLGSRGESRLVSKGQTHRLSARDLRRPFSPAWRALSLSSGTSLATEPPPLLSRGGLQQDGKSFRAASKSSSSGQRTAFVTALGDSGKGSAVRSSNGNADNHQTPALRFNLAADENGADEESSLSDVEDDDDDFHVAMLDGGGDFDFRMRDNFDAKSLVGSDTEDTPATTPRSPQSSCDLPEQRRASSVPEAAGSFSSESRGAERKESHNEDAVFAHALPPSSRRPHTHAGSLTLSLPFNEVGHASAAAEVDEEILSPTLSTAASGRNASCSEEVESRTSFSHAQVSAGNEKQSDKKEDSTTTHAHEEDEDLLSPSQRDLLGLEVSRAAGTPMRGGNHSFIMSVDHIPSSAFNSPAIVATSTQSLPIISQDSTSTLPPSAAISLVSRAATRPAGASGLVGNLHKKVESNADHCSDDDDDIDSRSSAPSIHDAEENIVLGPPEHLCLSELDRAWEQDKYLSKARQVAKLGGPFVATMAADDEHSDIRSVEEMMDLDKPATVKRTTTSDELDHDLRDAGSDEDGGRLGSAKIARGNTKKSAKSSPAKNRREARTCTAGSTTNHRRK